MVGLWYVKCQGLVNAQSEDLVFRKTITVQIHQEEYLCHFDKCHINPAFGRVFCYNISIEKKPMTQKNFFSRENLTKVALGYLYVTQIVLHDNKKGERCKMVKAAELPPIKMNGGL